MALQLPPVPDLVCSRSRSSCGGQVLGHKFLHGTMRVMWGELPEPLDLDESDLNFHHFQLPHLRDPDAHQARHQGEDARRHEGLGQGAHGQAQGKARRKGEIAAWKSLAAGIF